MGWIGVDLDGTLAVHEPGEYDGSIGRPIKPMVDRVKGWLKQDKEVRIVTARASIVLKMTKGSYQDPPYRQYIERNEQITAIQEWCEKHIGYILKIVCEKDYQMIELWDDRAVTVERNTGRILTDGRV